MANLSVNVRMYHVGELGDCFLLHFKEGENESRVLIDCGSFRNSNKSKKRLNEIVGHILSEGDNKPLDVVVGTHQHNDHVSGFVHCEEQFTGKVNQVWLSWLDDPKDAFARQVKGSQRGLVKQLFDINKGMAGLNNAAASTVKEILGFYGIDEHAGPGINSMALGAAGDDPLIPAQGVKILKGLGAKAPMYLSPGKILKLPKMEGAVKVYVLGPPRNKSLLFDKDPNKQETYDPHLAMAGAFAGKFLSAVNMRDTAQALTEEEKRAKWQRERAEEYFPFNRSFKHSDAKIKELKDKAAKAPTKEKANEIMAPIKDLLAIQDLYNKSSNAYRKIDDEWTEQAGRLALYLNSYTNNSSLVLAFELVESKKVLLFAADAQTGNWSSWDKIKWEAVKKGFNTRELLENTVLYKVGHHASHNATLVSAFEAMTHEDLVAMIPVDKKDPNIDREKGWKMPAKNLYTKLKARTNFRVLRMDDGFAEDCDPDKSKKSGFKGKKLNKPVVDRTNGFVEYKING